MITVDAYREVVNTTIWKFPIAIAGHQTIEVPDPAKVLHVGFDPAGTPALWILVNPDLPKHSLPVFVVGTGDKKPLSAANYVGTFVEDIWVWHVFVGHT